MSDADKITVANKMYQTIGWEINLFVSNTNHIQ
jgi:hypothetical protein